jgi:hypothetical protein
MRPERALSPVARIVLALAIGVAAMLVPSCGDSGGAGGQAVAAAPPDAAGSGGIVNRADWIDWTAPALP